MRAQAKSELLVTTTSEVREVPYIVYYLPGIVQRSCGGRSKARRSRGDQDVHDGAVADAIHLEIPFRRERKNQHENTKRSS